MTRILSIVEGSPSGLWRTLGKRVGCKPSRVRIPLPPPGEKQSDFVSGCFSSYEEKARADSITGHQNLIQKVFVRSRVHSYLLP